MKFHQAVVDQLRKENLRPYCMNLLHGGVTQLAVLSQNKYYETTTQENWLTVDASPPDAEADDAGDPVQELGGEQDGERLVEEHALRETLKYKYVKDKLSNAVTTV